MCAPVLIIRYIHPLIHEQPLENPGAVGPILVAWANAIKPCYIAWRCGIGDVDYALNLAFSLVRCACAVPFRRLLIT